MCIRDGYQRRVHGAPSARHALEMTGGSLQVAGLFLLGEFKGGASGLSTELGLRESEGGDLRGGCVARIIGLRGMLNGTMVTIQKWNEEKQRWLVEIPDSGGLIKSLHAHNLTPVTALDVSEVARMPVEDLRSYVRKALDSDYTAAEVDACLCSLLVSELQEVISALTSGRSTAARPIPSLARSSFGIRGLEPSARRSAAAAAEEMKKAEAVQKERAQALEARERELSESLAQWRAEVQSEAEQMREFEAEQRAAQQLSKAERTDACIDEEVERLREAAEEAKYELERQREVSRSLAEERELHVLEEEAEQRRMANTLRDEWARLEQQRRTVTLIQQSLLRAGEDKGGCVEMKLDEGGVDDEQDLDELWDLDWAGLETETWPPSATAAVASGSGFPMSPPRSAALEPTIPSTSNISD
eukprot:NODE_5923_length_1721_cov_6.303011.p1 GENE.NODE_5923_length_1721_cov_6.303011~~NODE_5923_length_1721_cov_6.303011.p1  ORF type:complete len:417 (+),score=101.68 NODE_5923_length_1721_cov_6.303011:171-1421(+)